MDPRLIEYYNRELQHVREVGGEFAAEFPKVAGRLGMDGFECADPYVERLLEGFAFMAARVQLKLDAQFPEFTSHLMEMVYPHYLAPTPSMAVVQFEPDLSEGALAEGFVIPRHSLLRSKIGKDDQTPCEYRTAHEVALWPVEIESARYEVDMAALGPNTPPRLTAAGKAAIQLTLRTTADLRFSDLSLDKLHVYLRGTDELPGYIYEQLLGNATAVVARSASDPSAWHHHLDPSHLRSVGFEREQALLPYGPRSFQGYRLLHEYFAFPQRYLFVEFCGLEQSVRRCADDRLELTVILDRQEPRLEHALDRSQFSLFCTPAVNLFAKRADRIHLLDGRREYHVVPDRTRPMDFEVYAITSVTGYGTSAEVERTFAPFYAHHADRHHGAHYTVIRQPRVLSSKQKRIGSRSHYIGSEVHLGLVDVEAAPISPNLRQLAVGTLCTNRDLPLYMPVGKGNTDFTMALGAPIRSIRCVAGPTAPKAPACGGEKAWRLISHLSLNYLSLMEDEQGASALRELLSLYADTEDKSTAKRIEALQTVTCLAATRRMPVRGPITFGRGLEIVVTCDDNGFAGSGAFLFGAVLEQFFSKYASINSFTETTLGTITRGEIMQWPIRTGQRQTL